MVFLFFPHHVHYLIEDNTSTSTLVKERVWRHVPQLVVIVVAKIIRGDWFQAFHV